jgi:hypothetical protein
MMVNAFMRDEAISYDQLQLEMVEIDAICRKLEGAYAPSPNPPRIELPENLDTAVAERIMGNSVEHLRSEEDGNYSSIFFDLHGGKDPDTSAYVTTKRFTNFEDSPVQITDLVSKYDIVYLIRPLTVEPSSTVFYAIAFSERPRAITLSLEDKTKLMHGLGYFYKCIVEANAFLHQMEKATFAELIRQNYQTEGNEITTAVISEIFQSDRDKRTILHRYLDIQTYIAKSFSDVDTTDTEYSTGNDRAIVSSHLRIG